MCYIIYRNKTLPYVLFLHLCSLLFCFKDSGWYKVDFSKAENTPFGIQSGCDFVEKDCIVGNAVPSYAEGNFCSDRATEVIYRCDPGYNFRGVCDLFDYRVMDIGISRPGREYFSNPFLGPGAFTHADWCPTIYKFADAVADCQDVDAVPINGYEVFGESSKCMNVEINGAASSLCLTSSCDNEAKQFVFNVQDNSYSCGLGDDGRMIKIDGPKDSEYEFTCPKLARACPE